MARRAGPIVLSIKASLAGRNFGVEGRTKTLDLTGRRQTRWRNTSTHSACTGGASWMLATPLPRMSNASLFAQEKLPAPRACH